MLTVVKILIVEVGMFSTLVLLAGALLVLSVAPPLLLDQICRNRYRKATHNGLLEDRIGAGKSDLQGTEHHAEGLGSASALQLTTQSFKGWSPLCVSFEEQRVQHRIPVGGTSDS